MSTKVKVNTWAYPYDAPNESDNYRTNGDDKDKTLVKIDGKLVLVQTRYNREDGSTAAIAITRENGVDTPHVLYTMDAQGNKTFGGVGRKDVVGDLTFRNAAETDHTTTAADAQAIIATARKGDNTAITQQEFFDVNNNRANELWENSGSEASTGAFGSTIPAVPKGTKPGTAYVQTTQPVQPQPEPKVEPSVDGQQPQNNPSGRTIVDDVVAGAEEIGKRAKQFGQEIIGDNTVATIQQKYKEFADYITITSEDIEKLESFFQEGGGDPIKGASYPIDHTYGQPFGQDYVTIDQFVYKSPRRDQIFGSDPLANLSQGAQRLTPLKEFVAQVKLPMPNRLADQNAVGWGKDTMNDMSAAITSGVMQDPAGVGLAAAGGAALGSIFGMGGEGGRLGAMAGILYSAGEGDIQKGLEKLKSLGGSAVFKTSVGSMLVNMAGVEASPESLLARGVGVIPNTNVELLFNAVDMREFGFSWRMSPRDEAEAAEVKKIIRFFKQGMAAKTMKASAGDRSLFLGTPNVFRIQFRTEGGEIIEGVNRIKPCAVTQCAVDYAPEGQWAAYDKGQPVSYTLAIRMAELEPIYASDYTQNVIGFRRSGEVAVNFEGGDGPLAPDVAGEGDLYPIRPSEVGY